MYKLVAPVRAISGTSKASSAVRGDDWASIGSDAGDASSLS